MRNNIRSKLPILLAAFWLVSCVSASNDARDLSSEQELDEWWINLVTNSEVITAAHGYDGISGRVMELLMLVSNEMTERHGARCGANPLTDHIFFYQEEGDVLRVETSTRTVPDNRPPPPPPPDGYRYIYMSELFNVPENSYGLEGCNIQFTIDKKAKQIISTKIIH